MTLPRRLRLAAAVAGLACGALALPGSADSPGVVPVSASAGPALGHDRIGVRRGDSWLLSDALAGGSTTTYREQEAGWTPVAGDTDGDGADEVHLFRDGVWLLRARPGALPAVVLFGAAGDVPLLGDWDADGTDTLGTYAGGTFRLRDGNGPFAGESTVGFGVPGDVPVVGDWDGDGGTDLGLRRGSTWFQRDAVTPGPASRSFTWGPAGSVPLAGDWDHDGRDTVGLFRDGDWAFRAADGAVQTTRFGGPGDVPVLRRVPTLAPGLTHRVVRGGPGGAYLAHVAEVDLAAASSPDVVLAQDRLVGFETVSSMARRTGAVLAVNGDYATDSGRPVHLFAADGVLLQSPQLTGRALALDASGTRVDMDFPDLRVDLLHAGRGLGLPQVNSGRPAGAAGAAWTGPGLGLPGAPDGQCYATTAPAGARSVRGPRAVTPLSVTGVRCGGRPPAVPPAGPLVATEPGNPFLRGVRPGDRVELAAQLGFPGAVDVLGGNPMLVFRGQVASGDVDGRGGIFGRNPRTAVGVTADGRLLVVVVDGRQRGWSEGATLRETAELMRALGAVQAVNLDGGGSTEMVLNGVIVNRPSDGRERPVSSGLVVLRGADAGQAGLLPGGPAPAPAPAIAPQPADDRAAAEAAQRDPASTGGLRGLLEELQLPVVPGLLPPLPR